MEPESTTPTNNARRKMTNMIVGRKALIDGAVLRHILPPEENEKVKKVHLLSCNWCFMLGHNKRSCNHLKKKSKVVSFCMNCGGKGHTAKWCKRKKFCTRCKKDTHRSQINDDCPMVRRQKAHNMRLQILTNLSRKKISRKMITAYVHWYNQSERTDKITTPSTGQRRSIRKRKRKEKIQMDLTNEEEEEAKNEEEDSRNSKMDAPPGKKRNVERSSSQKKRQDPQPKEKNIYKELNYDDF